MAGSWEYYSFVKSRKTAPELILVIALGSARPPMSLSACAYMYVHISYIVIVVIKFVGGKFCDCQVIHKNHKS